MADAVANYDRYRRSAESWMLGRFVVPAARLAEFERTSPADFPLSVLWDDPRQLPASRCVIDVIESKAADFVTVPGVTTYFEISDLNLIPAIAAAGGRAKIRAGGVTACAFPEARFIAEFLVACARSRVPFKATAGLHHALRCYRPLTYAADAPQGWMFGFLNVFTAAALAWKGAGVDELEPVLMEETLVDRGLSETDWREVRSEFAISFGSCSFEEPVVDLKSLGLI